MSQSITSIQDCLLKILNCGFYSDFIANYDKFLPALFFDKVNSFLGLTLSRGSLKPLNKLEMISVKPEAGIHHALLPAIPAY